MGRYKYGCWICEKRISKKDYNDKLNLCPNCLEFCFECENILDQIQTLANKNGIGREIHVVLKHFPNKEEELLNRIFPYKRVFRRIKLTK